MRLSASLASGRHPHTSNTPVALLMCALVAMLVGTFAVPSTVYAQAVTGTLLGNVTDSSGAAVPGATVTATETQTNSSRTAVSNEAGHYIFSSLRNGTYTVEAELQGFRKVIRQNVRVDVNTTMRVDLSLELGQLTESVTVAADTPLLQTDRTDTGRLLESKVVTEIPLGFNRNFQGLLVTVPGATRPFRPHSQFFNSQDSLSTEINGQPRMANNTLIEGLDNNQKTGLLSVIIPAADALETVSVSTSNYDAEFGRSGGAITNVTLKSGTNQLSGSAFFFGNTESTNASDYFTHLKAPTKFAQGGFTLGGPIVRNKFFFFGDYQRTIDNLGYVVRAKIPTMAMRNGDFSAVSNAIYDPTTGAVNGSGRTAFANNQIPQNRISPIARRLLAFIPEPNIAGAPLGQNNYQKAQVREKTTDAFDTKLNWSMSEKNQLSGRLSFQRPVVFDPGLFGEYGGAANGGFAGTGTNTSMSTAMNWTRVFSNTMVMDVRGGVNYYHNVTWTEGNGLTTSTDVGIPGANIDEFTSGLSTIIIGGYSEPAAGILGQPAVGSVGGDLEYRDHGDQAGAQPHRQDGRRVAAQPRHAAADAGRGRPQGPLQFQRVWHGGPERGGDTDGRREFDGLVPARLAERCQPGPEGHRRARHQAFGGLALRAGQVAGEAQHHDRPGPALGILHAAHRHRRAWQPVELRSGEQHAARLGLRHDQRFGERQEHVVEHQRAHRHLLAPEQRHGRARGLRWQHDPVPRQPLRVQLPGQAELLGNGPERIPGGRVDGDRLPCRRRS